MGDDAPSLARCTRARAGTQTVQPPRVKVFSRPVRAGKSLSRTYNHDSVRYSDRTWIVPVYAPIVSLSLNSTCPPLSPDPLRHGEVLGARAALGLRTMRVGLSPRRGVPVQTATTRWPQPRGTGGTGPTDRPRPRSRVRTAIFVRQAQFCHLGFGSRIRPMRPRSNNDAQCAETCRTRCSPTALKGDTLRKLSKHPCRRAHGASWVFACSSEAP